MMLTMTKELKQTVRMQEGCKEGVVCAKKNTETENTEGTRGIIIDTSS